MLHTEISVRAAEWMFGLVRVFCVGEMLSGVLQCASVVGEMLSGVLK
jgi:hypothetical protein